MNLNEYCDKLTDFLHENCLFTEKQLNQIIRLIRSYFFISYENIVVIKFNPTFTKAIIIRIGNDVTHFRNNGNGWFK